MAGGWSGVRGGILGLLDLIEEHRAAFEYDWRARFGMSLEEVPASMPWGEALRLAGLLRRDPSTWLSASMQGWEYPISRETAAILDLFDLEHAKASKKTPKPHGARPWITDRSSKRFGKSHGMSEQQVLDLLRTRFGQPEAPV